MTRKIHGGSSSVAVGFRHVDDDSLWLAGFFLLDGGEGAEEEVAGIGHDGSAARGDAVLGLEEKEAGEKVIDGYGGAEFSETGDEFGGEIGGFVKLLPTAGVLGAKGGERIRDGHPAAAVASVVLAATIRRSELQGRIIDKIGVNRCGAHVVPRFSEN